MIEAIAAVLQTSTAQDWMSRLVPLGVVTAEVSTLEHALTSVQTKARNIVVEIAARGGTIRSIGNPVKTSSAEALERVVREYLVAADHKEIHIPAGARLSTRDALNVGQAFVTGVHAR